MLWSGRRRPRRRSAGCGRPGDVARLREALLPIPEPDAIGQDRRPRAIRVDDDEAPGPACPRPVPVGEMQPVPRPGRAHRLPVRLDDHLPSRAIGRFDDDAVGGVEGDEPCPGQPERRRRTSRPDKDQGPDKRQEERGEDGCEEDDACRPAGGLRAATSSGRRSASPAAAASWRFRS